MNVAGNYQRVSRMNCLVVSIEGDEVKTALPFCPTGTQQAFRRARAYAKHWRGKIELSCRDDDGNWNLMDFWENDD